MATRTMPFCLQMLTFGYPESSGALLQFLTRGGSLATRTVPFRQEMLTFGHPESSGALGGFLDAERAYGHSHSTFLVGNANIWPPRELWRTFRLRLDAGRAYGHSNTSFLPHKCLHLATQRAPAHFWTSAGRGEGPWLLEQCLFAYKCLHLATQASAGRPL